MCVGFWSLEHPQYALILCSNRDEYLSRPTAPAHFHSFGNIGPDTESEKTILSGRDLRAGGTWLGVGLDGKTALLTNITEEAGQYGSSRGQLVSSFLLPSPPPSQSLLADHMARTVAENIPYAGFNLLLLSPKWSGEGEAQPKLSFEGAHVTNHGGGGNIVARSLTDAERHHGGLSNGIEGKGADEWPKVKQGLNLFSDVLDSITAELDELELAEQLFQLLTWKSDSPPRERGELRNTIHIEPLTIGVQSPDTPPDYYGTRLSTVILVGRDGRTLFIERDIWTLDAENKLTRGDAKHQRAFRFHLRA
ncbi:hypothetical protein QCA50_015361 [Cerrena zonata]|uniref:DUF833-domain-containing protein n=1 Tax=Cerrena zonata TaxID=2478898 RepID=A0AAW0FWE7_9APHY